MRLRNKEFADIARMMSHKEAAAYLGLGLTTSRKLLEEIGATRHVGARVLFDRQIIDNYLDSLAGEAQ